MGAFALKAQKYGRSHFERSKVIKGVGALALNAQTVWELSLYLLKSMGALALSIQK